MKINTQQLERSEDWAPREKIKRVRAKFRRKTDEEQRATMAREEREFIRHEKGHV